VDPLGFHITFRLLPDRNIAPSPAARRLLARTIAKVARPFPVLAFRWADTHGHVLVVCTREVAGELARRIEIALQHALKPGVPFAPAFFTPIADLHHLRSAFAYILKQDDRHGFANDPCHEASNLVDLLRGRVVAVWTREHVIEHLPRTKRSDLLAIARWDGAPGATYEGLADAAAAAVALPNVDGNRADAVRARRAAIEVGSSLPTRELARLLGMTSQGIRRLRRAPVDADVVRAVHLQLGLRARPVVDPLADNEPVPNETFDPTSLRASSPEAQRTGHE
jgi:hypothetical protein